MNDFRFEPGLTRQDIAYFLLQSAVDGPDVPVFGLDGATARVVFASDVMLNLFQVATLEALTNRLRADDPGARRLADLTQTLPLDGGGRLERLRFFFGQSAETLTFLCRRLGRPDRAPLFVAAALNVRPALMRVPVALLTSEAAVLPEAAMPPRPMAFADVEADFNTRFPAKRVRFLWRTDAQNRFVDVTPPLADVVGSVAADLVGRDIENVVRDMDLDSSGRLAECFAQRVTWSQVEVAWPIFNAAARVPIVLGATPTFDRQQIFEGYRGFGVADLSRLVATEQPTIAPAVEPMEEPAQPVSPRKPSAQIVPIRPLAAQASRPTPVASRDAGLSDAEQNAFQQIALLLSDNGDEVAAPVDAAAEPHADRPPSAQALIVVEGSFEREALANTPASRLVQIPSGADVKSEIEAHPETKVPIEAGAVPQVEHRPEVEALTVVEAVAASQALPEVPVLLDLLRTGLVLARGGEVLYVNRALLDLLGYPDSDAFRHGAAVSQLLARKPGADPDVVGVASKDGTLVRADVRTDAVAWGGQTATLVSVEARPLPKPQDDVRHAENEARELRAVLDTATDGVVLIDGDGLILSVSRSAEALFGFDQGDIVGQHFTTLIAPENQAKVRDYLADLKAEGVASLLNDGREFMGRARQGGLIPMFMTLGRISSGANVPVKFCALLRDMTHWKKVEQELEEARHEAERASALKSDFLAKVSHEIRTPLNAILGFAEVIMEERFGAIGNERYKDYLKDIHASGAHVMSLVNDLLDLSKIEAGKMELDFAPVDANSIIEGCVSLMQPQASRERIIMRLSLAPNLPLIQADARSLKQIILNLLSNAVKFNEPGGQVIVATAVTEGGHAVIRVRDTGIGMSDSDIEIALEPFRQLATSKATSGTGLGLPLTRALVEANRAFFSIKSKKREGTLVEVAFPATAMDAR